MGDRKHRKLLKPSLSTLRTFILPFLFVASFQSSRGCFLPPIFLAQDPILLHLLQNEVGHGIPGRGRKVYEESRPGKSLTSSITAEPNLQ